ncbi:LexA family transcriptional regulator [Gluconobacter cerinus]|nr:LexA family transcriptional regulator [Gluconobacter cerinus]
MSYDLLMRRIKERLDALGMSERKACLTAGVGINTIRHIRVRGHAPKPENLHKLATTLGVPPSYFLEAAVDQAEAKENSLKPVANIETIYVKGFVQAGHMQEAIEWPASDWMPVYAPPDIRYPSIPRFGLQVRGDSMNRVYPDGSIVVAVKLDDLGRLPRTGERVVVLCRSKSGSNEMEATVKKYQIDQSGRHILWPESDDPLYQSPIILDDLAKEHEGQSNDSACEDVCIYALIVGSYRTE